MSGISEPVTNFRAVWRVENIASIQFQNTLLVRMAVVAVFVAYAAR